MSMVGFKFLPPFHKVYFNLGLLFFVGSVAQEPSLLSDFGLACFLGLYEEVKKACVIFCTNVNLLINNIIYRWSNLELLLTFVVMKHHTV